MKVRWNKQNTFLLQEVDLFPPLVFYAIIYLYIAEGGCHSIESICFISWNFTDEYDVDFFLFNRFYDFFNVFNIYK